MTFQAISLCRRAALELLLDDARNVLMVDSFKGAPFNMRPFDSLNPFHLWPQPCIPVPGQPGLLARSVEAVWQGLKQVDGSGDFAQFLSSPSKRPSDDERRQQTDYLYEESQFIYGERTLDLVSARLLIYLPTYLFMLHTLVPVTLIQDIHQHLATRGAVVFYDWDANQDITDPSRSFSHSALLASWFNGTWEKDYRAAAHRSLAAQDLADFNASMDAMLGLYPQWQWPGGTA